MKIKFNLQFRLLIVVGLVVVLTLSVFYYLSVNNQKKLFYDSFRDSAISLAQALDANIGSKDDLNDIPKLQSNIYKVMWLNPNIFEISMSLPVETGLKIVASNDTSMIGEIIVPEDIASYQDGAISTEVLTETDNTQVLKVITPLHVAGQQVGIYDIRLSLHPLEEVISKTQRQFLSGTIIAILVIITVLFFSIKTTVINPIRNLQEGMKVIGTGKLEHRIKIKRKDEIGGLASGFNEMAEKLRDKTKALSEEKAGLEAKVKQRTRELEEARSILEVKVKARTKELEELAQSLEMKVKQRTVELEEKVGELERFQKLVVRRELKMIELKQEIKALKIDKDKNVFSG